MRIRRLGNFSADCRVYGLVVLHLFRRKNWQGRPPHVVRAENFFIFIHRGAVDFHQQGEPPVTARTHDMVYIPKGIVCSSVYSAEETEISVIQFQMADDDGDFTLSDSLELMEAKQAARYEPLYYAFHKIGPCVNKAMHCAGALYDLLTQLNLSGYDAFNDRDFALISPGVDLLVDRFRENIPVSEMAKAAMVSECYFRRLFKRFFLQSPISYRNYLRVQYANDLCASGLYTMSEAANAAGIDNASYFYRLNKRFMK